MANTLTHSPKTGDQRYTVSELNALFTSIKTLIDNKVDLRGCTMQNHIAFVDGTIINVPPAVTAGDILQVQQS